MNRCLWKSPSALSTAKKSDRLDNFSWNRGIALQSGAWTLCGVNFAKAVHLRVAKEGALDKSAPRMLENKSDECGQSYYQNWL